MTRKNVFAWTAPGVTPQFISVNESMAGLRIHVRAADGRTMADMELPEHEVKALTEALVAREAARKAGAA